MSLQSWIARKAAERAIKRAEKGEYGPEGVAAMDWIRSHKKIVSAVFAAAAAGAHAFGYDQVASGLGVVFGLFFGGGAFESDAAHKEGRAS